MQELGDLDRVERGIPRRYAEVTLKHRRGVERDSELEESLGYVPSRSRGCAAPGLSEVAGISVSAYRD